jgi:hypothetical protein
VDLAAHLKGWAMRMYPNHEFLGVTG